MSIAAQHEVHRGVTTWHFVSMVGLDVEGVKCEGSERGGERKEVSVSYMCRRCGKRRREAVEKDPLV
jgi:hypothetical protein